ncbi:PO21 protein, partial [Illadopsis cleaveri]|nr:PO21 protein [Illadopsis cleaveri]
ILTGVKQGDPMSPVLFNLALDPLLCKLETEGKGFQRGGLKVTAMTFADDLVPLSDSWESMHFNIKILETFCELTGLHTQGE